MGMMKEFKEFAMRGNLIDVAVAFVMGAAFGKIVSAFVDGMVMPLIGMLTGGIDFSDQKLILKHGIAEYKTIEGTVVPAVAEVAVRYGELITALIDFIVVAFAVFLVIKAINAMKKAETPPPAAPTKQEELLMEIRDQLKNRPL